MSGVKKKTMADQKVKFDDELMINRIKTIEKYLKNEKHAVGYRNEFMDIFTILSHFIKKKKSKTSLIEKIIFSDSGLVKTLFFLTKKTSHISKINKLVNTYQLINKKNNESTKLTNKEKTFLNESLNNLNILISQFSKSYISKITKNLIFLARKKYKIEQKDLIDQIMIPAGTFLLLRKIYSKYKIDFSDQSLLQKNKLKLKKGLLKFTFKKEDKKHKEILQFGIKSINANIINPLLSEIAKWSFTYPVENDFDLLFLHSQFESLLETIYKIREEKDTYSGKWDYNTNRFLETYGSNNIFVDENTLRFMYDLADLQEDETVYDPNSIYGDSIYSLNKTNNQQTYFAYDENKTRGFLTYLRFFLAGKNDIEIMSNKNQKLAFEKNKLDCIISIGQNKKEDSKKQYVQKFENNILHILNSLKDRGRAVLLLPENFLYDTAFKNLRINLIENYNITSIISWNPITEYSYYDRDRFDDFFFPQTIIVFSKDKPKNKISFLNPPKSIFLKKIYKDNSFNILNEYDFSDIYVKSSFIDLYKSEIPFVISNILNKILYKKKPDKKYVETWNTDLKKIKKNDYILSNINYTPTNLNNIIKNCKSNYPKTKDQILNNKIDFFVYNDNINKDYKLLDAIDKNDDTFVSKKKVYYKQNDLILYKTRFKDRFYFGIEHIADATNLNYQFSYIILRCKKGLNPLFLKKIIEETEFKDEIIKILYNHGISEKSVDKLKKWKIPFFTKYIQSFFVFNSYNIIDHLRIISILDHKIIKDSIAVYNSIISYINLMKNSINENNRDKFANDLSTTLENLKTIQNKIFQKMQDSGLFLKSHSADLSYYNDPESEMSCLKYYEFNFPFNMGAKLKTNLDIAISSHKKSMIEYYLFIKGFLEEYNITSKNKGYKFMVETFEYLKKAFLLSLDIEEIEDDTKILSAIVIKDRENWEKQITEKEHRTIWTLRHNVNKKIGMILNAVERLNDDYDINKNKNISLDDIKSIKSNANQMSSVLDRVKQVITKTIPEKDFLSVNIMNLFNKLIIINGSYSIANYTIVKKIDENIYAELCQEEILEVFNNLIDNSIKHGFKDKSKQYQININANHDTNNIIIDYINNGLPWPKYFPIEDFTTFSMKGKRSTGEGIGGMYIKKVLDLHKGSIKLIMDDNPVHLQIIIPKERENDGT